jgi:hypothetical protein
MGALHQALLIHRTTAAGFVPTDEPTLDFWLTADSLALSDNDPVVDWLDQSPSHLNYGQNSAGAQPKYKTNIVNGRPVVRFDGNDQLASDPTSLPWTTANTVIWCGSPSSTNGYLFAEVAFISHFGGKAFEYFWPASGAERATFVASASGFHILTLTRTNGTGNYIGYFDGAQVFSNPVVASNWNGSGLQTIGARTSSDFATMDLCQMMHYSSILNSTSLNNVHTYLGDEYGISITLI